MDLFIDQLNLPVGEDTIIAIEELVGQIYGNRNLIGVRVWHQIQRKGSGSDALLWDTYPDPIDPYREYYRFPVIWTVATSDEHIYLFRQWMHTHTHIGEDIRDADFAHQEQCCALTAAHISCQAIERAFDTHLNTYDALRNRLDTLKKHKMIDRELIRQSIVGREPIIGECGAQELERCFDHGQLNTNKYVHFLLRQARSYSKEAKWHIKLMRELLNSLHVPLEEGRDGQAHTLAKLNTLTNTLTTHLSLFYQPKKPLDCLSIQWNLGRLENIHYAYQDMVQSQIKLRHFLQLSILAFQLKLHDQQPKLRRYLPLVTMRLGVIDSNLMRTVIQAIDSLTMGYL